MNKKTKLSITSLIVLVLLGLHISSVIATSNTNFFKVNKQEIKQGETLEMTLDISSIKYEKFEFVLSSNLSAKSIVVNESIQVENDKESIKISIDKENFNLSKITFYYPVPEDAQPGATIELLAQIVAEKEVEEENNVTPVTEQEMFDNTKIQVKVVKKQDEPSKQDDQKLDETKPNGINQDNMKSDNAQPENNTRKQDGQNSKFPSGTINNVQTIVKTTNIPSIETSSETTVYKGSNNNYLSSLEVEGESLNTNFSKENTNYFIKTSGKTNLNVNAVAEDSSAKIKITGNSNLQSGDNKILISVTAKNGDVRYYRVYVTNN